MIKYNKTNYFIIMRRIISDSDLLPLRSEITKINSIHVNSPLTFEYIDFLTTQSVDFSFKQMHYHNPVVFEKNKKEDFISLIKMKKFGFLEFKNNDDKKLVADYFLDTFIGKDFFLLEKLFNHIDFRQEVCDFYRTFGLMALSHKEKNFYNELIEHFNYQKKYDLSSILHKANIPYLMQHHNELFKDYNLKDLLSVWVRKIDKFENLNTSIVKKSPTVGNVLYKKAQVFTLKLAGLIMFKQPKNSIMELFEQYTDILSQRVVFDFFKDNKCSETAYAFGLYRNKIEAYKNSTVEIEEQDLIQKNLNIDISSIMTKHLLTYDRSSQLLKGIGKFFQEQDDFKHSLINFDDNNKKCILSVCSTEQYYLKNATEFVSKVVNDKDLLMNPDNYKTVFSYIHFNNKYEVKNIVTKTKKI